MLIINNLDPECKHDPSGSNTGEITDQIEISQINTRNFKSLARPADNFSTIS